jgi:hypothetical protein
MAQNNLKTSSTPQDNLKTPGTTNSSFRTIKEAQTVTTKGLLTKNLTVR